MISREWRQHMSDREYSILTFISDHTAMLGKDTYRFTYKSFTEGTALSCGTGKSEAQVREIVRALEVRGMIEIDENKRDGLIIGLNLEWSPMGLPTPKRLQNDGAPDFRGADRRKSEGQTAGNPHPLKNSFLEQSEGQSSGAFGSAGTAPEIEPTSSTGPEIAVPSQIRQRTRPTRLTTNVDDVQRQFDLGDATRVSTAGAPDQHKAAVAAAKLKASRELKNAGAVWSTWEAAWNEVYAGNAGASLVAWTKVQNGILNKTVIAKWKGDAASLHEFIDWTVREWAMIRVVEFGWMKRDPAPLTPSLKFFLAFHHRFASLFNRREVDRALSGLSAQERIKREMMLKRGASAEEADREIAKGKARAELRDEIDEGVRRARQIEREAAVTQANTEKLNREHLRKVQRIAQRQPVAPPEPMRYLSPEELQQALQQVSNFTVEPFDESR